METYCGVTNMTTASYMKYKKQLWKLSYNTINGRNMKNNNETGFQVTCTESFPDESHRAGRSTAVPPR